MEKQNEMNQIKYENQISGMNKDKEEFQKEKEELINSLREDIERYKIKIDNQEDQNEENLNQIKHLKSIIESLNLTCQKLNLDNEDKNLLLIDQSILKNEINELEKEIKNLHLENENLNLEIQRLKNLNEQVNLDNQSQIEEYLQLKFLLENLNECEKNEMLSMNPQEFLFNIQKLNKIIEEINSFRDNFHLSQVTQQIQIQEAEISNLKEIIDQLNAQVVELNQVNQQLNDSIDAQVSIIQEQSILIDKLENQLSQNQTLQSPIQGFHQIDDGSSSSQNQIDFNTMKHNFIKEPLQQLQFNEFVNQSSKDFVYQASTLLESNQNINKQNESVQEIDQDEIQNLERNFDYEEFSNVQDFLLTELNSENQSFNQNDEFLPEEFSDFSFSYENVEDNDKEKILNLKKDAFDVQIQIEQLKDINELNEHHAQV
jgi:hypothetical protein